MCSAMFQIEMTELKQTVVQGCRRIFSNLWVIIVIFFLSPRSILSLFKYLEWGFVYSIYIKQNLITCPQLLNV